MYMKDGKATLEINGIQAELLKNLEEDMYKLLCEIISSYEIGDSPKEFFSSRTIIIPRKGTNMEYSSYKNISKLSQVQKIFGIIKYSF